MHEGIHRHACFGLDFHNRWPRCMVLPYPSHRLMQSLSAVNTTPAVVNRPYETLQLDTKVYIIGKRL